MVGGGEARAAVTVRVGVGVGLGWGWWRVLSPGVSDLGFGGASYLLILTISFCLLLLIDLAFRHFLFKSVYEVLARDDPDHARSELLDHNQVPQRQSPEQIQNPLNI